jgi:hypothetical protein
MKFNVCKGLPQGDVLSPELFNMYTATIHNLNGVNVKILQYADDIVIFSKNKNKSELVINSQRLVNTLIENLANLKLKINAEKTMMMPFFMNDVSNIKININGIEIKKSNFHYWLGMSIDRGLTCGRNVREIGSSWGGHPETISILYKGVFRNQLEYGNSIFTDASKTNLKSLEVVNRQALRRIGGFTNSTPINSIYAILCEPPLTIRWDHLLEKYILKAIKNKNALYKNNLINLSREIGNMRDSNNITYSKDMITVMINGRTVKYKKRNYSRTEFKFLELFNKNTEVISQNFQNIYNSWTEIFTKSPHVSKSINNVTNKKAYLPLELKSYTIETINKYNANKCIYTDASKRDNCCSVGIVLPNQHQLGYKLKTETPITCGTRGN